MSKLIIYIFIAFAIITMTNCESGDSVSGSGVSGKGGSLARFAIKDSFLYTVDEFNLNVFSISNAEQPLLLTTKDAGINIETIYPYKNNLFLGSQTGLYIFDISTPGSPAKISEYWHVYSCDPVVVDDNYAYVTLRSENSRCGRFTNELQIIDIQNPKAPKEKTSYPMSSPKGLGIDGSNLFICDAGLKLYDVSKVDSIKLIDHFTNVVANDVIPNNGNLIVTADNGIMQYSYSNSKLTLLSTINVKN